MKNHFGLFGSSPFLFCRAGHAFIAEAYYFRGQLADTRIAIEIDAGLYFYEIYGW